MKVDGLMGGWHEIAWPAEYYSFHLSISVIRQSRQLLNDGRWWVVNFCNGIDNWTFFCLMLLQYSFVTCPQLLYWPAQHKQKCTLTLRTETSFSPLFWSSLVFCLFVCLIFTGYYFDSIHQKIEKNELILKEELKILLHLCQSPEDVIMARNAIYR